MKKLRILFLLAVVMLLGKTGSSQATPEITDITGQAKLNDTYTNIVGDSIDIGGGDTLIFTVGIKLKNDTLIDSLQYFIGNIGQSVTLTNVTLEPNTIGGNLYFEEGSNSYPVEYNGLFPNSVEAKASTITTDIWVDVKIYANGEQVDRSQYKLYSVE